MGAHDAGSNAAGRLKSSYVNMRIQSTFTNIYQHAFRKEYHLRPTSMQAPKTFIFAKNMAHSGVKCGMHTLMLRFNQTKASC
jgi:hypothetical protein